MREIRWRILGGNIPVVILDGSVSVTFSDRTSDFICADPRRIEIYGDDFYQVIYADMNQIVMAEVSSVKNFRLEIQNFSYYHWMENIIVIPAPLAYDIYLVGQFTSELHHLTPDDFRRISQELTLVKVTDWKTNGF